MKLFPFHIAWLLLFSSLVIGQTNPAVQGIPYSEDFGSLTHASTIYPNGWQGWNLGSGPSSSAVITPAINNFTLTPNSSASTNTPVGVHNYDGKIGFLHTASADPSLCLAINTTGKINISVTYDIMTIRNPYNGSTSTRINEVTLQYRIGTSGNFTTLTGIGYQNNTTTQNTGTTGQKIETKNITLPSACENVAAVQLRWVLREISGGGARPSFAMDDITITGISSGCPVTASFTSSSTVLPVGNLVLFTNSSGGANSYSWKENNAPFSTTASPSRIFGSVGNFIIKLIASDGTCSDSDSVAITVVAPIDYNIAKNWLCHPMKSQIASVDPSNTDMSYTYYNADLSTGPTVAVPYNTGSSVDVFFVLPTGVNDFTIPLGYMGIPGDTGVKQQDTIANAIDFINRIGYFVQFGRIYAPNYRKAVPATFSSANKAQQADLMQIAAEDVMAAFQYYLANNNNGKKIILVGHSQGSIVLSMLLRKLIDNDPALKSKLIVAVLAGNGPSATRMYVNDTDGKKGGWMENVPICENPNDIECVMGWVSWQTGQALPTVSPLSVNRNDSLEARGFIYQKYAAGPTFKVKDDPIGFNPLKPVSKSLFPKIDCGNCVTTTYAAYTNMYDGSISESSNTSYNFTVINAQQGGDLRPDPLPPFNPQFGYHTKDYNLPAQDIIDLIKTKICVSKGNFANAGSDITICAGNNTTLNASGGTSYLWVSSPGLSCTSCANPTANPTSTVTYTVTVTDADGCTNSDVVQVAVQSFVAAGVSIFVSPSSTICSGTSVTCTASVSNGGISPSYQWKLNGGNVGTNSAVYNNASLANGDVIICEMISSLSCATGSPATSNSITMTVNTTVVPSVSIITGTNTICAGTFVTLTAAPINGGSSPSYQWKLNGGNVGTNNTAYSTSSLANGDIIACVMTSNAVCPSLNPVTSNSVAMTVNPVVSAGISIAVNANPICTGDNVTFTASGVNGGPAPSYQWKLNGGNAGTNSATYSTSSLANGDTIACVMMSNESCVTGSPTTSNSVTMIVTASTPAGVSISVSPSSTICLGTSTTLTAVPSSGGTSPSYQWKLNGGNVGTNSAVYNNASLTNGDVIVCEMTSSLSCAIGSPVTSNTITVTINPLPIVNAGSDVTICNGQSAALNAASNLSSTSCSWIPSGSLSDPEICNPVAIPAATTAYIVTVTDINDCSNRDTLIILVLSNPMAVISQSLDTICLGNSTILTVAGGTFYLWNTGETTSVITVNPTVTTTYTVVVSNADSCTDTTSASVIVETCTGIYPTLVTNNFVNIFPTPFTNELTIQLRLSGNTSRADIKIYSVQGSIVKEIFMEVPEIKIASAGMPQGMYFIKIITQENTYFRKIIRE